MRSLLIEKIENPPTSNDLKPIPSKAVISFLSTKDTIPRIFKLDPATQQIAVNLVKQWDYPIIMMVIVLSLAIPVVGAALLVFFCISAGRKHLEDYRQAKLKTDQMTQNLSQILNMAQQEQDTQGEFFDDEKVWDMMARTNFFYMFEEFIGDADAQRTPFAQWLIVAIEVAIVAVPNAATLVIGGSIRGAWQQSRCEFRADKCNCLAEIDVLLQLPQVLTYLVFIFFAAQVVELALYYLSIPYNVLRRVVRHLFYVSIFSAVWLAAVAVFVIILFVLLGVLIDPIAVAPYAIALLGIVSCCVALYAKLTRFATRVRRAVQKRIEVEKKRLRRVPPILLDAMIERNVDQAMHENGLSFPAIVIKIFFFACFLAAVYVFLFVGFSAFTDTSSWVAGAVNAGISAILAIGAQQALAKDGEEQDVKDDVDEMQARVMRSVIKVMEMVAKQMDLAMRLFTKMKKGMNQDASEGESSTVDVEVAKI
jgi:hypothetical protein